MYQNDQNMVLLQVELYVALHVELQQLPPQHMYLRWPQSKSVVLWVLAFNSW